MTLEDLIEELVGDIEDEYDLRDRPSHRFHDGSVDVDGLMARVRITPSGHHTAGERGASDHPGTAPSRP